MSQVSLSNSGNSAARPLVTAALFGLVGLYFLIGGGVLAFDGGSWFYGVLGAAFLTVSGLLWRRSRYALIAAGTTLAVTIVWSLFEVGLDIWGLEVRLLVPTTATAWLLLPPIRRNLEAAARRSAGVKIVAFSVAASIMIVLLGTKSLMPHRPDEAFQMRMTGLAYKDAPMGDWRAVGGTIAADRFSALAELTPKNVGGLKVAWVYHTGASTKRGNFEATPLKIGNTLYICTSRGVAAIDADSGRQRWLYTPPAGSSVSGHQRVAIGSDGDVSSNIADEGTQDQDAGTCRGLSYYDGSSQAMPDHAASTACVQRLFEPTRTRVIALDLKTGRPCQDFGTNGILDITQGLGPSAGRWVSVTSAPLVIRDKLIIGQSVSDNQFFGEPAGVVRAYDLRSGRLVWAWDVGRTPTNKPLSTGEIYTPDTPNAWGQITGDAKLGLAYVPTGVSTPDYYGGQRRDYPFDDAYSTSVVALDVNTGLERWHFQTVHHDLWDMDVPVGPSLIDLVPKRGEKPLPALVQSTKLGELFVLDRRTGKPIFKVVEKAVPQGDVAGEYYAPTQPFVSGVASLRPADIRETDSWGATIFDQLLCRIDFRRLDYKGEFTPPSLRGALVFPAYFGVTDWSGVAIDPLRQIAVQNMSYMPWKARLYRRQDAEAKGWIKPWSGKGPIPPRGLASIRPQYFSPYVVRLEPWVNALGVPCKAPPFGQLAAYDLRKGKILWKEVFGTSRHNAPLGLTENLPLPTGMYSVGGSVVTTTGLTFIAATTDRRIRAFETETGRQLWSAALPVAGHSSPMTYLGKDGRQYVVIAAGGNWGMRDAVGDTLIAFALGR